MSLFAGDIRVPLWVKKGGMKFPADPDTSVIMIGPGTGVAPFRAAIQERVAKGQKGEGWAWNAPWCWQVCIQHIEMRNWVLLWVWTGSSFTVIGSKLGSEGGQHQREPDVCRLCGYSQAGLPGWSWDPVRMC